MSHGTTPCRLCINQAELIPTDIDGEHRRCPHCGEYKITGSTLGMIDSFKQDDKRRVSIYGWIRNQNYQGHIPTIDSDILKRIASRPLPSVAERADLLLLAIVRSQNGLFQRVNIKDGPFVSASYSQNDQDVHALARMLREQDLIRGVSEGLANPLLVNFAGYKRADELLKRPLYSATSFVAMRFVDELDEAYDQGISVAVLNAGYEPIRVDRTEHVDRIDDKIIAHIRASAFIIADFTEHSPGVYFEAGFALGLGLPVIWTCRKDHMKKLHFDIRQYNCIDWESHEDLATRLQHRIEAIAGKGPKAALEES